MNKEQGIYTGSVVSSYSRTGSVIYSGSVEEIDKLFVRIDIIYTQSIDREIVPNFSHELNKIWHFSHNILTRKLYIIPKVTEDSMRDT